MMKAEMITRRNFAKLSIAAVAASGILAADLPGQTSKPLRLGGPVDAPDPETWIKNLRSLGYRAAYCPVGPDAADDAVKAYAYAARKADIVIAEVGAWSNPISGDDAQRKAALDRCRSSLALADRIGANCCVNVSGSRNPKQWAGPCKENLTQATFDLIVETTRSIIDAAKPTRTFFTLECMPWAYPDSVESYQRLITAIDRKQFAVHFDPVNLVVSPQIYYASGAMIREAFEKLGPRIRSCHAKDITLDETIYTPHLTECRAGTGGLDYAEMLRQLAKQPDTPLMLEHLPNQDEYKKAADHIRAVATSVGVSFT